MARDKPPRQMPWTAVTLDLSFDVQKELDIAIGAYISELDAIEREAGGRPDLEKQTQVEDVIGSIREKRSRSETAGNAARVTRAKTRGHETRANVVQPANTPTIAPQSGIVQTKAESGKRIPSHADQPGNASNKMDSGEILHIVATDRSMVCEDEHLVEGQEVDEVTDAVGQQRNFQSGHHKGDRLLQDLGGELGSDDLAIQPNTAGNMEDGHQPESQVQCGTMPTRCVLQPIAESPYMVTGKTVGEDGEMHGHSDKVCDAVDAACGNSNELPEAATPAGHNAVAEIPCDDMKGSPMDDGHDAELDKDKVVKNNPEQAAEESPSLGMHAQGVHVVDMGGTSGDENWLGSVGSSIDSPAAAAAALINEENHDLPCADAGDAHAVDLTPEESPSPLPPGVWTDNPGSGTSISLPQLDGRASRDSTPRMCTGGMEGQIGQGGGQTSVRKIHQAPPLADLQSKLHKLHASCQKKQPSQAKDCKDAMAVAAAKGTAISNVHAEMLDPNSVSHGLAGGRAVLHDGPAEAKGSKGTSHGIKFFHGATLLEKMQAMEKAPVLPASGSKGKTGIKSIQVAEKARLQAEKERERKEAHKKAVQAEVAANKAKRLAEAVLAGGGQSVASAAAKCGVIGKPVATATATPEAVPPPAAKNQSVKTPQKPGLKNIEQEMCNVTPTQLRHDLAAAKLDNTPDSLFGQRPTPCAVQYPVTPFAELCSVSDDESGTIKNQRQRKAKPAWGEKDKVQKRAEEQMFSNPERILGICPPTCDLMDLFGEGCGLEQKLRYTARRASRNWGDDAVTDSEVQRYNNSRGFHFRR